MKQLNKLKRLLTSYTFHCEALHHHLLTAATCCTGTPVFLDPRPRPRTRTRTRTPPHLAPPVRQTACGPPPGCSASPGWGIRSEPPAGAGPEPDDPEKRWYAPGPDTSVSTGRGRDCQSKTQRTHFL